MNWSGSNLTQKERPLSTYKKEGKDWTQWGDEEFVAFMERHVKRPGALFNVKMIERLYLLAGRDVPARKSKDMHVTFARTRATELIAEVRRAWQWKQILGRTRRDGQEHADVQVTEQQ